MWAVFAALKCVGGESENLQSLGSANSHMLILICESGNLRTDDCLNSPDPQMFLDHDSHNLGCQSKVMYVCYDLDLIYCIQ